MAEEPEAGRELAGWTTSENGRVSQQAWQLQRLLTDLTGREWSPMLLQSTVLDDDDDRPSSLLLKPLTFVNDVIVSLRGISKLHERNATDCHIMHIWQRIPMKRTVFPR